MRSINKVLASEIKHNFCEILSKSKWIHTNLLS